MKKLNLLFTALLLMCCVGNAKAEEATIDGIKYNVITKAKQATVINGGSYSGNIVIPSEITYNNVTCNVTSIGNDAFYSCSGLTSIEIPGSVTSIGDWAFRSCSCLTSVTSLATTAPALGSGVFSYISSDATLYYPAGSDYSSWAQYFANTEEITEEFPEEEEVFGDLNGDGTVSVSDIQVLVNIILGN